MTDPGLPPPIVDPSALSQISDGVWVIQDRRVPLVPNIGVIVGARAALVVDTGMGRANGAAVLGVARKLAGDKPVYLTITHFHPEHGYGAEPFKTDAHIIYNATQGEELARKGEPYLAMFRGMGPSVAAALEATKLVAADELYPGEALDIDLGGRTVALRNFGRAHTNGDQIVYIPEDGVLFSGDLAEERTFPIFPWFPPEDADIDADGWVRALEACLALKPEIVVPGHGDVGGPEILTAVRNYILDLRARVRRAKAEGAADLVAAVRPDVVAAHPDWHLPEWIDFAIRYFAATDKAAAR